MPPTLSRRTFLQSAAFSAAALGMLPRWSRLRLDPDRDRLATWVARLRAEGCSTLGHDAVRVGELAEGTPYQAGMLDAYLRSGVGAIDPEPLTCALTQFDCVTLVESCLAVGRTAELDGEPTWERFSAEIERMRYRDGGRRGYASRLHYFSEWISDGARRGLVRDLGPELGAVPDRRPLRFMSEHRASYPALASDAVLADIVAMERRLDSNDRNLIPTERIPEVADHIESGDVLAFATSIPGLDVTHAAFAHRSVDRILRVLHAPLSGGVVGVSRYPLPEYVAAIRRSTGMLVVRPVRGAVRGEG